MNQAICWTVVDRGKALSIKSVPDHYPITLEYHIFKQKLTSSTQSFEKTYQMTHWKSLSKEGSVREGSLLRGCRSKKSTFLKNWRPVRGPMSFAAKGKKKKKKRPNPRQTNTSHCPTKTISKSDLHPLKETLLAHPWAQTADLDITLAETSTELPGSPWN